jgi:cysteinyl-tRNA synthetase
MELRFYDTLAKIEKPSPFEPIDPTNVRMYVCGPTVYDFAHMGNARPIIVFDVVFRLLRHVYGKNHVKYVRNITDVDDKINDRAARDFPGLPLNEAIRKVTELTEKQFQDDAKALKCLPPSVQPRATDHIGEMYTLIEKLIANNNAYVEQDHVLFNAASDPNYGQLARRSLDEMRAGARVDVAPYKRGPMDFVLWKPSKPNEPSWPSPGGITVKGRPGWHIECSAMAWKHLGEHFDIHGGGIDLVFPHHENELAQSCCAFHEDRMANVWMHNGFLQIDGAKMAKSEGNFFTIRELRKSRRFGGRSWTGDLLRFAMLQTHYRQPIDWTVSLLEQSEARLEKWKNFAGERTVRTRSMSLWDSFFGALADDLNTPAAFALIDRVVDQELGSDEDRYTIYRILQFLGLKTKTSRTARVANSAMTLIRSLGAFSENDWENLSRNIISRPQFKSGALKPESKLLSALTAISDLRLNFKLPPNTSFVELEDFKKEMVKTGKPAQSDFEVKVRRLIIERDEARKAKKFQESDRIREKLTEMGVVVRDIKDASGNLVTTWEKAR